MGDPSDYTCLIWKVQILKEKIDEIKLKAMSPLIVDNPSSGKDIFHRYLVNSHEHNANYAHIFCLLISSYGSVNILVSIFLSVYLSAKRHINTQTEKHFNWNYSNSYSMISCYIHFTFRSIWWKTPINLFGVHLDKTRVLWIHSVCQVLEI